MARGESQNLLICTIVFLILLLIMIIVSVVMRSKYTETAAQLADATQKNSQLNSEVNNLKSETARLREMIGHQDTSLAMADVETAFADHMRTYAAQEGGTYKTALGNLAGSYDNEKVKNRDLELANASLMADNAAQLAKLEKLREKFESEIDLAKKELKDAQERFTQVQEETLALGKQREAETNKVLEDSRTAIAEANRKRAEIAARNEGILIINDGLIKTIVNFESPTPTYHNAEIMSVNAGSKLVYINVGSAHGLRPQMSFSVYSADVKEISRESSKGKVEVVRIIDDTTAEARVTEDVLIDPIIPGDIVYTPVWRPGQKIRFALSSGLDLEGDGDTDPHKVIGIIRRGGGEVDAYIDDLTGEMVEENGKQKREAFIVGQITDETRYLVTGDRPDPESSVTLFNARREMQEEGKMYGLIEIPLKDLLNFMGMRPQSQTVGFGPRNRAINNYEMEPDVVNQRMPGRVFNKYEDEDAKPATNDMLPVSPLFNQRNKISNPTGTASPLFKPRSAPLLEVEKN